MCLVNNDSGQKCSTKKAEECDGPNWKPGEVEAISGPGGQQVIRP